MASIVGPAHAALPPAQDVPGFDRSDLALAVDARGTALLVGTRANRDTVLLSERPRGGAFGAFAVLRDGARTPREVAVAAAGQGAAIAAWREGGSIAVSLREPGGAFGTPRVLARGRRPQVAIAPDGEAVVTWLGNGRARAAFRPAGEDFQAPRTLSGTGASAPRLAMAGGTTTIAFARRPAMEATTVRAGVFAPTRAIGDVASDGRVAVAARGSTSVVGWVDRRSVSTVVRRDGAFGLPRTRTTSRLILTPPQALVTAAGGPVVAHAEADGRRGRIYANGRLLVDRPGFADLTGLTTTPSGALAPAWIEGTQRQRTPDFRLAGERLDEVGPQPVVTTGEGPLVARGRGEVIAVWSVVADRPRARWTAGRP